MPTAPGAPVNRRWAGPTGSGGGAAVLWWLFCVSGALAWSLGSAHDVGEPVTLEDPLYTWTLSEGTLYDVHDDAGRRAGFVFVGASRYALHPGRGRPVEVLANRLVSLLGFEPAEARSIGEAGALSLGVDGAVVLGVDAWDAVAHVARPVVVGPDRVVMVQGADGEEEVLVQARKRLQRDRRRAEIWLRERTQWMSRVGVEPAGLLDPDRWEAEAQTGTPSRWVASLRTELDWGLYAGDTVQPRVVQPWLELLQDPSGVLDPGVPSSVWASGPEGPRIRIAHGRWPEQATPRRVDATGIGLTAYFSPDRGAAMALEVGVTADLRVEAVGGPVAHVVVDLPHVEQREWYSMPSLPHAFELVSITTPEGEPLEHRMVSIGPQEEGRGAIRTVAVRLDEPLQPGASTTVRIKFTDLHRFAHIHDYSYMGDPPRIFAFGSSTGLVRVLPQVRSHQGPRVPVALRAGVAPLGKKVHVVASHANGTRTVRSNGRWLSAQADSHSLRLAVGRWHDEVAPARDGAVELGLHPFFTISEFDRVAEHTRSMISMYQGMLPPFPHQRLELVEAARDPYGGAYTQVANATLASGEAQLERERQTLFGGARLASSLHAQWWMPLDVAPQDALLPETTSLLYTLEGLRATGGQRDVDEIWRHMRDTIHRSTGSSDVGARRDPLPSLALALGPILQDDAGSSAALFAAVDRVLSGAHAPSWDGLAAGLQEATGRDWEGFLLTWVHSGTTPKLDVTYDVSGDRVVGWVHSDLPFGAFRLPVRLGRGADARWARIPVEDGSARFVIPWDGDEDVRLTVDPRGVLPLRGVSIRRGGAG